MKNFVLVFLLCFAQLSYSQNDQRAFCDSSLWSMSSYLSVTYGVGERPQVLFDTRPYYFVADTVIEEVSYQKLMSCPNGFYLPSCELNGYLYKEDNQVYYGLNPNELEVIMDYNLSVGDSFRFDNTSADSGFYYSEVLAVDSIDIMGSYHKRITFNRFPHIRYGDNEQTAIAPVWVEGMGDYNYGLIVDDYSWVLYEENFGAHFQFHCFNKGKERVFGNCEFEYSIVGISEERNYMRLLYPNPVNSELIITPEFKLENFSVYDTQGTKRLSGGEVQHIDVSNLKSGVYFFEAITKDRRAIEKFVKE